MRNNSARRSWVRKPRRRQAAGLASLLRADQIGTEADAEHATAVFNKLASNPGSWITIKLDPRAGFAAGCSRPLDYCFVAVLTEDVPKLKCTPISLAHATSKPSANITITIWQHPQGGVKVMSNFHVEKMTDEGSISYQNDTEPGSSGSPIFDNVGRLVGIHAQGGSDANSGCLLFSIANAVKADSMSMGKRNAATNALLAAAKKAGDIASLVALARDGTDGQKEQAGGALRSLAVNADNQVAIARAGGIAPLVALARGGTDGQKDQAAGALGWLACNADNKVAIARAGGIAPLVALARGGTDGQEAAWALGRLACNDDNKVAIAKAGGIAPLVALARGGTDGQRSSGPRGRWGGLLATTTTRWRSRRRATSRR